MITLSWSELSTLVNSRATELSSTIKNDQENSISSITEQRCKNLEEVISQIRQKTKNIRDRP
jgi:hypothetical protein